MWMDLETVAKQHQDRKSEKQDIMRQIKLNQECTKMLHV